MENLRVKYEHINRAIKNNIKRKNIDIPQILEKYSEGISEDNIRMVHRLDKEELSYILRNYTTAEIIEKRKKSQKLLDGKMYNLMGLSKKQQKEDEEVLPIKEALALFEER